MFHMKPRASSDVHSDNVFPSVADFLQTGLIRHLGKAPYFDFLDYFRPYLQLGVLAWSNPRMSIICK